MGLINSSPKLFPECQELFLKALQTNRIALDDGGHTNVIADQETPPQNVNVEGFLQISNSRIYGSAANLLKLLPTKVGSHGEKFSLSDKLRPYWTKEVCNAWVKFMGEEMVNTDPEKFQGQRKDWLQGIDLVVGLNIPGFKSGLSVLQLANNLVLARILNQPTLIHLATWIWSNQRLGAFRGLSHMGFIPINRDAVFVALQLIYNHLDTHLSIRQKDTLRWDIFGVLIIEHFLCKIQRWSNKVQSLNDEALKAEEQGELEGTLKFPFPLRQTLEEVKNVLASLEVRSMVYLAQVR